MDREKFFASLAKFEEMVALSGSERVGAYERHTKTGKTVHVSAYTRDPGKMSNTDLFKEFTDLKNGTADLPETAQQNRKTQIVHEIQKRRAAGTWGPEAKKSAAPAPAEKAPAAPEAKPVVPAKKAAPAPPVEPKQQAPAPAKAAEPPKDAKGGAWQAGADHALSHFLDEKHAKQSSESGGVHTPDRNQEAEWSSRVDKELSQPLDDDTVKDLTSGPSTADGHLQHHPDGSVTFTPERQALHKKIISAFLDGYAPMDKPRYHMMGGGPASGKSVMEKANPEISEGHAVINADEVKGMIPEAWQKDGTLNAGLAHEESSHIAKQIQKEAFARQIGVTLDGTGDGGARGVRKKLQQARSAGYEVHAYYVSTDVETALKRAAQRASKPPYRGVPETLLRKTHKDVSATFKDVVDEFDSVKLYDSTTREGVLTGEKKPGGRFEILNSDAWNAFVAKAHATD